MDSDHLARILVEGLLAARQARHQTQELSHLAGPAASGGEYVIIQRLAQAEQLIRQQRPAAALAVLQAPGAPPDDWPQRWHPRWSALVGWALIQHHQPDAARSVLQQGLVLFDTLRHQPDAAELMLPELGEWLRYFLGVSYCQGDQPVQALRCHRQGLAAIAAGTIHDPELTMLLYQGLGHAYLSLGADTKAIAYLTLARKYGQDVCNPYAEGVTEWSLGLAYTHQGNLLQARCALKEALHRFEQLDAQPLVARMRALLGQVLLEQQHEEEAEAMLRQALGAAERLSDQEARWIALDGLARLHLAHGKPEHAIRLIQAGLDIFQKTRDQPIAGQLSLTLARAYEVQHDHRAAEAALKTAIQVLQQTHQQGLIIRAHERYGQFLASQGRFAEAYIQVQGASLPSTSGLVQ